MVTDWDAAVSSLAGVLGDDLRAAVAAAAAAGERTYYDADADRAAAQAYYDGVGIERLAERVQSTHKVRPEYRPSIELYPWVDLQPDGKLRSLYTAEVFEPQDLIQADFEVMRQRAVRLLGAATARGDHPTTLQAEVEAELPFNCEHVVPQSWFGADEPMRGDLHHLFACESRCNGFRANTAFAEFPDFPLDPTPGGTADTEGVRGDCGKSESGGFEPANGAGAAARACFYFRLRYPDTILAEQMPANRWEMLLAWHERDPVTLWEQHRNASIFERQGNRNPFIDHPEWLPDAVVSP